MLGLTRVAAICWLLTLAAPAQQVAPTGVIAGRAAYSGNPVAGVTVTVVGPAGQWKAVTKQDGTYRFEQIRPGIYRLDAFLPGFRRVQFDSISVGANETATRDIDLKLAVFVEGHRLEPADGVIGALREAAVIIHLEIAEVLGPHLINKDSVLATGYVAKVHAVVKTDQPAVATGSSIKFDQLFAGRMTVDGQAIVGFEPPYERGQSLLAFLRRNPDSTLSDLAGETFMLPVAKGFVVLDNLPRTKEDGLRPFMPIGEALAALRKLLPR
jgi:hypothetical protein